MTDAKIGAPHKRLARRPFLSFCLGMAAFSVAIELVHCADGRFSASGNLVLQAVPAGMLLYGLLDLLFHNIARKTKPLLPLFPAAAALLLAFTSGTAVYTALCALFGAVTGMFACGLLASLATGGVTRRYLKLGVGLGLLSSALYPVYILYEFLRAYAGEPLLRAVFFAFSALLFLASFIFASKEEARPEEAPPGGKKRSAVPLLLIIALFVLLTEVLNSGTLEKHGGTANLISIYIINVALRLPIAALMGYLCDKGLSRMYLTIPLSAVTLACAASLFFFGDFAGDVFIFLFYDLSGKTFIFFMNALSIELALRMKKRALAACAGTFANLFFVAFANLSAIGLTPEEFAADYQQPLTIIVIICSIPLYLWLIYTAYTSPRPAPRGIPAQTPAPLPVLDTVTVTPPDAVPAAEPALLPDPEAPAAPDAPLPAGGLECCGLTEREREVAALVLEGLQSSAIAERLYISERTVKYHLGNIFKKAGVKNRMELILKMRNR